MDFDFTRIVRAAMAGTERDAGQSGPAAKDSQAPPSINTGDGMRLPTTESGSTGRLDRDARGPAQRGSPNDFGWKDQDRVKFKAMRRATSTSAARPPARASTWIPTWRATSSCGPRGI